MKDYEETFGPEYDAVEHEGFKPDEYYMLRAIELAKQGAGNVNPNPMVGAVIVKDDEIIGEGYHERFGELHAERNAIASLEESAEGADIYVTLEPCCHTGKTPPCTEAIIEAGIKRVIIGSRDPNPKVSGGGVRALEKAGIEVIQDFLKEECDDINPAFFHYITTKTPYVCLKYAMTLDGKIATKTGASKWISGEESREYVHFLRHKNMAIMAGIGTVLADDPMLNCRMEGGTNPIRVICDSKLQIPLESNIIKTAGEIKTIIACAYKESDLPEKAKEIEAAGARLLALPGQMGRVDLKKLMALLGEEGIDSVLVEGGGILNEALLKAELVNEICVFIAPKIFGGQAKSPVEGDGVTTPGKAYMFKQKEVEYFGKDIMIRYVKE